MSASGSAGNFQSIPALTPDQVPVPSTRGSVNMYMNLDDNLIIWTVDTFKIHRPASSGSNSSINGETKTFLVPLDYTMFNDTANSTKTVAVGRLPLGYRYFGFIFRNDVKWESNNQILKLDLFILDTVSGFPIDIPVIDNGAIPSSLATLLPSQQMSGSVSVGVIFGGNAYLDADGLQGISVTVQMPLGDPLNLLANAGSSSLYIIATKIPTSPDSLLAP